MNGWIERPARPPTTFGDLERLADLAELPRHRAKLIAYDTKDGVPMVRMYDADRRLIGLAVMPPDGLPS